MDTTILARIYLYMDKQEEIKHLLGPNNIIFPVMRPCPFPNKNLIVSKQNMIEYNIWREEIAKMSAIFNTLILISSKVNLADITEGLFERYRKLARQLIG
jgi:hypothetical protein